MNAYKPVLIAQLEAYHPYDETEAAHVANTLEFLKTHEEPFSRSTLAGHITASAVLIDHGLAVAALIFHEKLGRWFQPGGHCEPALEATVPEAALRELVEETGIAAQHIHLVQTTPFDIDVHEIPARGNEPTHFHYDIRYLFQSDHAHMLNDAHHQWKPIPEVALDPDPSRSRFATKLMHNKL